VSTWIQYYVFLSKQQYSWQCHMIATWTLNALIYSLKSYKHRITHWKFSVLTWRFGGYFEFVDANWRSGGDQSFLCCWVTYLNCKVIDCIPEHDSLCTYCSVSYLDFTY
jgi:hypothetical protein